MIIPKIQIVTALRFFHRYFIWIWYFSYVIAGVMPELGLWIRNIAWQEQNYGSKVVSHSPANLIC